MLLRCLQLARILFHFHRLVGIAEFSQQLVAARADPLFDSRSVLFQALDCGVAVAGLLFGSLDFVVQEVQLIL